MSKIITTTAIMKLYEEGALDLDAPIAQYIPGFANPDIVVPLDCSDPKNPIYDVIPAQNAITVRTLLNHTSGISYAFNGPCSMPHLYQGNDISDGLVQTDGTIGEMVPRLSTLPILHEPGTRHQYGLASDVLGHLVEIVSGQSFSDFLAENIFRPLEMTDTAFFLDEEAAQRMPSAYFATAPGVLLNLGDEIWDLGALVFSASFPYLGPQTHYSGGGGLSSTPDDFLRFAQMLLNGGKLKSRDHPRATVRILKNKTVRLMTQSAPEDKEFPDGARPGYKFGKGFSIHVDPAQSGRASSMGAYGWGGFFSTSYLIDPAEKLVLVYMGQQFPPPMDLYPALESLIYDALIQRFVK